HAPGGDDEGVLEFGKGLSTAEEPHLVRQSLTGEVLHWIDVGQPDERRLARAAGRARRVTVIGYHRTFAAECARIAPALARFDNIDVWSLESSAVGELATLADRAMALDITVQDGVVWVAA